MIYYLTYILIALTMLVLIYIKPGFIRMISRNMAESRPTVGKRIFGFAGIIFCALISIYMIILMFAGVMGIFLVITA